MDRTFAVPSNGNHKRSMSIASSAALPTGQPETDTARGPTARLQRLQQLIDYAGHLLPSQGPITSFVHHNTLHAFEHLPFEEGLRAGYTTYGAEPFLPEDDYRQCVVSGRIRQEELSAALIDDLGDQADVLLGLLGTRYQLRMAMLEYPVQLAPAAELRWLVEETDALRRFPSFAHGPSRLRMVAETRHWVMRDLRNDAQLNRRVDAISPVERHVFDLFALFGKSSIEHWTDDTWESFCLHLLWRICLDGSRAAEHGTTRPQTPQVRLADDLKQATHEDCDQWVHELLIRFCAAFLDQGYAHWRLPERERGFFAAFGKLYAQPWGPPNRWLQGLNRELRRITDAGLSPLQSIEESLHLFGIDEEAWEPFIVATLQALPGWAGMIWQMETNAEWTLFPAPAGSLTEFLAVRLILDRLAATEVARQSLGWRGCLRELPQELSRRSSPKSPDGCERQAYMAFRMAQVCNWLPRELSQMSPPNWRMLLQELEDFSEFERRRIFHRAYERRYRNQVLDGLIVHRQARRAWGHESGPHRPQANAAGPLRRSAACTALTLSSDWKPETTPSFQIICCIDDREESFRRHLEEVDPCCETFGTAGFFGVAMYYRGATDAHARPLCPVIIKPKHYVNEEVAQAFVHEHRRRAETRRVLGSASHQFHLGSRTFFGGVVTAISGSLASIPMVARVMFPRTTAQIRQVFGRLVRAPAATRLLLERTEPDPGPANGHIGYTVDEMTTIVERVLRDIGLTQYFAPIVILCGHGSSSLNNPHESAYNCGACSGGRGGPNARAFAEMANDVRVREALRHRGLDIPGRTTFVGAFHNTCDDSITFFDLDRIPAALHTPFERVCDQIDEARRRNAHERCRRFRSAPLSITAEAALRHVQARSEDLAQARPEYNHATNALVLVGHRWWSRQLFLDRRAFLQSYDPSQDDAEHNILAHILAAVIPVCGGISLEYYFSCVDNNKLGCGSKLPHNITSLLGVMEGAASDLRPGLSQQMIEIHEPMRALFVVETTPAAMLSIMDRNPVVGQLCRNEWVQIAVVDPNNSTVSVYRDGKFAPYRLRSDAMPRVRSSAEWYRGWREHLGLAVIEEPRAASDHEFPPKLEADLTSFHGPDEKTR